MSQEIRTEVELDATPDEVWNLLSDVSSWREWSKVFSFLRPNARPGGFAVLLASVGGPLPAALPVRFDVFDTRREIRWHGGTRLAAHGSHYLQLEPLPGERTRLVHGEVFSGPLIKAGWPLLGNKLPGAYHAFNKEVARRLS